MVVTEKKYCVYKHTCPNGKVYIGITSRNPLVRWNGGYGYLGQPYFWNAIVKYGWDNIKHDILFSELTADEAGELEKCLIAEYDSTNTDKGYNISYGGYKGNVGLKRSEETRSKLSESNRKRWQSMNADKREKEAERCRHMFEGHRHTEQSNKKNMMNNPNRKTVIQLTVTGELVAEYNSIREAEKKNNIKHPCVSNCINGKTNTAGGFVWKVKNM